MMYLNTFTILMQLQELRGIELGVRGLGQIPTAPDWLKGGKKVYHLHSYNLIMPIDWLTD